MRTIKVSEEMYRWIRAYRQRGDTMNRALARAILHGIMDAPLPEGRRIVVRRYTPRVIPHRRQS